jgi:ribulose-5-phosphate 4-epimerase/fuculose-1-phosphate aldolase
MKQAGFTHDDFYGAQLFGDVGYHDFEGITVFADEKDRMLESLGQNHVLVLRNHGVAVCERNVPQAFRMLWTVQRAAEIQCQAGMLPGPNTILEDKVRQKSADVATSLTDSGGFSTMLFNAVVRKMRRERGPLWEGDTGIQRMG